MTCVMNLSLTKIMQQNFCLLLLLYFNNISNNLWIWLDEKLKSYYCSKKYYCNSW